MEGSCYRIAGTNAITLDHRSFDRLDEFSFSAWLCCDRVNIGEQWDANTVISIATDVTREELYFAQGLAGADFGVNIKGRDHGWHAFRNCRMKENQWLHVVLTRKAGVAALFMDGRFEGTTRVTAGALVTQKDGVVLGQHQHTVGGSFAVRQCLNGRVDDVMVYSRALTAEEVAQLHKFHKDEGR